MYRRILLLVVFVIIMFSYAHAKTENGLYIDKIKKRGYLKVAMLKEDQFPFFFKTLDGKLMGLDVKVALNIAKSLNVNVKFNRSSHSFNDLIPLVESGEVDLVISKLSRTLARSTSVLFSNPYIVFRQSLLLSRVQLAKITSNDDQVISVLRSFKGKLGVIKDSSYERYAKINFPKAEVVSFDTWDNVLDALNANKVFGIYRDEMEILKYVKKTPKASLYYKIVVFKDKEDPIAIAVPAKADHFLYFVNLVLENIKDKIPKNTEDLLQQYNEYEAEK